ncbi:MAG: NAD(P)H-dependent oxidoreductase [Acidobacteria bacterium]|nr:NAD(P)H-dependent oxidoreductase [Acidobacteriota bacterium]
MSDNKLRVVLLLGTNRKHRKSENAAKWLFRKLEEREDISARFFDPRDFQLPHDHYGMEIGQQFPEWKEAVIQADGIVIVTPEYNHGYPGILKSILDLLLKEYIHKAVGLVGVSAGSWGGTRVIETLLPVVRELGLVPTFTDINFTKIGTRFDEEGNLLDEAYEKRAAAFIDELVWMATTLRWGRENVASKYHQDKEQVSE